MGNVLRLAQRPAIGVPKEASVREASRTMVDNRIGAVLVYDGGVPSGIFSERDVMGRVVLPAKSPRSALTLMLERHIRHLPVVGDGGAVLGMLSIRHLMQDRIDELNVEIDALDAYASYDGATG
jgi:CBS domain-containing protein